MGRHLQYAKVGHVILVSEYPILTAVNGPQNECAISDFSLVALISLSHKLVQHF